MDSRDIGPSTPLASEQLFRQRVRNNIMDYLALAGSPGRQRDYERSADHNQVPSEVIQQWEDWVHPQALDWFHPPVFSTEEGAAICHFQDVWRAVTTAIPRPLPTTIEALIGTPSWTRLVEEAQRTLAVFERRGRSNALIDARLIN